MVQNRLPGEGCETEQTLDDEMDGFRSRLGIDLNIGRVFGEICIGKEWRAVIDDYFFLFIK